MAWVVGSCPQVLSADDVVWRSVISGAFPLPASVRCLLLRRASSPRQFCHEVTEFAQVRFTTDKFGAQGILTPDDVRRELQQQELLFRRANRSQPEHSGP